MFIVEDVASNEQIFLDATKLFINQNSESAKRYLMLIASNFTVFIVLFCLYKIKYYVVTPISELTDAIINPEKTKKVKKVV
jgi:nitrate/nitrite-specific signal transduction histidine kinase